MSAPVSPTRVWTSEVAAAGHCPFVWVVLKDWRAAIAGWASASAWVFVVPLVHALALEPNEASATFAPWAAASYAAAAAAAAIAAVAAAVEIVVGVLTCGAPVVDVVETD